MYRREGTIYVRCNNICQVSKISQLSSIVLIYITYVYIIKYSIYIYILLKACLYIEECAFLYFSR